MSPLDIAQAIVGALLVLVGIAVLIKARRSDTVGARAWPVIGVPSPVTRTVLAAALIVVGYHLVVYAMGWAQLRAPLMIVLIAAPIVVLLSMVNDVIERRGTTGK